jgi:sec-independent protein translocase protein TatB
MFDISFAEMLVVGMVALVVLGPERLPRVARTLGHLFGRAQRYVNDVKNDIQHEIELEELQKLKSSVEDAARSVEEAAQTEIRQFQKDMVATETKIESAATDSTQTTPAAGADIQSTDAVQHSSAASVNANSSPEYSEPDPQAVGTKLAARN